MSQTNTRSKSAADSEIIGDKQNKCSSDTKELQLQLIELQKDLQTKNSMIETAASMGKQLVNENDDLHNKLEVTTKLLKEREDELETLKKTNDMLEITATRSGVESDELHKQLVESHKTIQQLREEYALLKSMNDTSSISRESSDSFNKHTANDIISKLKHEKKTLQEFLHSEQEKCCKFLQNAEINARKLCLQQNENQDLKLQITKLQNANNELTDHTQLEITKYCQTLHQLQFENDSLQQQLNEQQQIANAQITETVAVHRNVSLNSTDDLHTDLQTLGYFDLNEKLLSPENLDDESIDSSFRKATMDIDALEEFFRLTVIAAKIKFHDVPMATGTLLDKVKEENLSFHEVADWLNEYLSSELEKQNEFDEKAKRTRITSITDKQLKTSTTSGSKHFFRKIKHLADSVTTFSSTLRLEVRFGRRVFEVKMKKHDKIETLLQTLPRLIGEDAECMEIYHGKNRLNPKMSLAHLDLNNNDTLRMIHKKEVASYLERNSQKNGDEPKRIEMSSENGQSNE